MNEQKEKYIQEQRNKIREKRTEQAIKDAKNYKQPKVAFERPKELDKLEALHEKENDIVEKITDIIDEEDNDWGGASYGGTNGD
jgi:lysyl-tRNA synthetase class I